VLGACWCDFLPYRIYVPDTNSVTCTQDVAFFDETSTIKVHYEEPILDFSNLPSSRPTVLQQPPTPVPENNAGLADSLLDTTLDDVDRTINAGQEDSDSERTQQPALEEDPSGPPKSTLGVELIWDFKGGTTALRHGCRSTDQEPQQSHVFYSGQASTSPIALYTKYKHYQVYVKPSYDWRGVLESVTLRSD